jgi:hypothetical protein
MELQSQDNGFYVVARNRRLIWINDLQVRLNEAHLSIRRALLQPHASQHTYLLFPLIAESHSLTLNVITAVRFATI